MARVTKINVGGTNYDIAHEGVLKNSGFEVVTSLPTTNLFEGREVVYQGKKYMYASGWKEITGGGGGNTTIEELSEDKLVWGKESLFGAMSPIDVQIRDNDRCNMMSFINPDAVSIEYSRDGGDSWIDYGLSPKQKNNFFMKTEQLFCGNSKKDGLIANPQFLLRITIDAVMGSSAGDVSKTILWCTSSGKGNWCTVSSLTNANYNAGNLSDDFFVTKYNKIPIGGGLGWNTLNFPNVITLSSTNKSNRLLRYTFGCDNVSSGFGLRIDRLVVYSYLIRLLPSNMAKYGHLYDYDYMQNALFPAKVVSNEVINFNVNNIEPTQTGNVTKTSTWLWKYLVQAVNWLKANDVRLSAYNTKVAALEQADSDNNASVQSVSTDLTELSNGLATVARSGSYNDLTDTPTLADVATSGDYNDLLNRPALVFQNIGGTISSVQIPDGLIANSKLANSSMTLNDITVNLGDTAILPWYVDYNEVDYPARIRDHWLQIYRNGVWANLMYLGDILPTQVGQITSFDSLDWYNEQVSEYEVDSNTTTSILNGTTLPATLLLSCTAERLTINLYPISGKQYGKGSLDSLISDLQGKGFSVFVENDLDAIIGSGSDYLVRIKISKVPTVKAIIECYVAK